MIKLDKWMLERVFEPAACEVESWTGVGPYRLSRVCALVATTAAASYAIRENTPTEYAFFGVALLGISMLVTITFIVERLTKRLGTGNFLKHNPIMSVVRMVHLFFAASAVCFLAMSGFAPHRIGSIAITLAWFFVACDRLPPKERRVLQPAEAPSSG